ncbi:hypothetical protein CTEN210_18466 [Chaetoceros tenuissimus]|uniref:Helicase-associated domain-containing protein n=1 Tax=Chaetoceros tenuissimus TaxID=426638 RepID=A0AAD3DFC5_9STRA|nr:hypothetical protein CTEN210_18466 [Chaetoceros tenuissimus]
MNYTWKTVYGDQRLVDLARELRGKSADSEEEEENGDDYSDDDDNDSDDHEFINDDEEEGDDDNDEEEDSSSSEEEEVKESKFDKRWNDKYKQLKEYKAQNGHCNVPRVYEPNKALGTWVYKQRQEYRKMSEGLYSWITQERVEKLENIGFSWVVLRSNDTWNESLKKLKEFKAQNGHCNVPQGYEANKALGKWVSAQRQSYILKSKGLQSWLTEERVEKLNNIGFVWAPKKDTWHKRLEQLKEFKAKHGHCNVPQGYKSNKSLAIWLEHQRFQHKLMSKGAHSNMTEYRVEKLESIGILWNPNVDIWNDRYKQVKEFKAKNGHCNVPREYAQNKTLGSWVHRQRTEYSLMKKGLQSKMTEDRVEKLENIGFVWSTKKDTWKERYEELKEYHAQQGHCNVPSNYEPNKTLGNWVGSQRAHYRLMCEGLKSSMTEERVEKLENIGFEWKLRKNVQKNTSWDERLRQLKNFKAQYGHCNVSANNKLYKSLGIWVGTQRSQYKQFHRAPSDIIRERIAILESMGFVWTPMKDTWKERFEDLKIFKAQFGHCNVPGIYEPNKSLGKWVNKQRVQYRLMCEDAHSNMTRERVKTLESIGFEWSLKNKRISHKNATVKKHSKKSIVSKNNTVKRSSKKRIARKNATVGRRSKRLKSKK